MGRSLVPLPKSNRGELRTIFVEGRRPGNENWGVVQRVLEEDPYKRRAEAERALHAWRSTAADHRSCFSNWDFRITE